jgi:hypothetical protein
MNDLQLLQILQNWICKGLFQPFRNDYPSTSVRLTHFYFVHPVIKAMNQVMDYTQPHSSLSQLESLISFLGAEADHATYIGTSRHWYKPFAS